MRHGRGIYPKILNLGKQLWRDGSIYEGYWKENLSHGIFKWI